MKIPLYGLAVAVSAAMFVQTASAAVLLTDNFHVTSNSQNVNQEINGGRQAGPLAPALYSGWRTHHQVGNTTTDVGQPGGPGNSDYVLIAFNGSFFSDLPVDSVASGPLTIEFDIYRNPGIGGEWAAFALKPAGDDFPVTAQFGFLQRGNGGVQAFQNGSEIDPGWDTAGFAASSHWTLTFSDTAGTGSAFNGNGSQVILTNGTTYVGTLTLGQLSSTGLRFGWQASANGLAGIANLSVSGTPGTLAAPGQNLSFEYDTTSTGTSINVIPSGWTAFNQLAPDRCGSQNAGGTDYSVFNPLAATATGQQFCWINRFNGDGVGGIYQDMGPMQSNTIYTLTVAIGSRQDRFNSPGTIQLVNGTDNTGTVLATGGGLPGVQDSWQDFSVSFTNGPTASGDVVVVLSALGASTIQANFDNVRLTTAPAPAVIPPSLVTDVSPLNQQVATGTSTTFTVTANGSLPLSYQWFNQGGPIGGATSASYSFSALAGTNSYYVTVANSGGAVTSSVAQVISATNIVTVRNFSFEDGTHNGSGGKTIPVQWSDFNNNNFSAVADGTGGAFGTVDPLAPTADSTNFFAINEGPGDPTGGIYQDVGTMLPNTIYTLTVAVGRRADTSPGTGDWSPGILTLINGTNNTGAVLATVTGHPGAPDSWQDFSVSYTNVSTSGHLTVALSVAPAGTFQGLFDNVRLTIAAAPAVIPPSLMTDVGPLRQQVTTGTSMAFTVTANGSLPLSYQWFNQSGPIGGATSATYSFSALAGTNSYYVTVTNTGAAVTSSVAQVISATNIVTVRNFSFEDGTHNGSNGKTIPVQWSDFSNNNFSTVANDSYSTVNPLAPPADGNDFFAINEGPSDPTGGIYQDVGPLLPNTTYTLTVATGLRMDFTPGSLGSPGIISLINGANNSGTVLASTNGIPTTSDTWQNNTVSFNTGPSVSGDLTVALSVAGASTYQANFDNVQLTKAPYVAPPAAPNFGAVQISGGNLILTATGGSSGGGYTLLTTTNLSTPNAWTTNSTGTLDGVGAFTNSIPIGTGPARFYRVRVP